MCTTLLERMGRAECWKDFSDFTALLAETTSCSYRCQAPQNPITTQDDAIFKRRETVLGFSVQMWPKLPEETASRSTEP